MNKITSLFASKAIKIMLISIPFCVQAQNNFPYDNIPLSDGAFNATININTGAGANPFNNLLLGSNVDFNTSIARVLLSRVDGPNGRLFNQGFNSIQGQQFIADNDPVVLRFPQGVFANTYNWEPVFNNQGQEIAAADSRHITDPFVIGTRVISQHDSPKNVRIGYPSLRGIFDTAANNGKPLDLLTVISIINNDADSNGRRWQSMINDGHDVRDMELGNEFFFRSQRSGTINTEAQWVARARAVVNNIKNRANQLNRSVRFAIPISFRGGDPTQSQSGRNTHQRYNDLITADESFFDAIVVHRYVNAQREDGNRPENLTPKSLRDLVSASTIMDQSLTYSKAQVSSTKDAIWLTEWGVAGSEDDAIGASFLGAADIYSHIINNNDRLEVERINWFSTLGLNAQYALSGSINNIQVSRTGYGNVYSVLRDNLRDSEVFNEVSVTVPELKLAGVTQQEKSLHVISVRRPDGNPRFIITNKTNQPARMFVNRDGVNESRVSYAINGFRWESLASTESIVYTSSETSVNAIIVPAYAVVKVDAVFGDEVLSTNDFTNVKKSVTLYPNPTSSVLNIDLNELKTAKIVIRDILGKVVYNTQTAKTSVQINTNSLLKAGLYFVVVTDENNQSYINKLIVK